MTKKKGVNHSVHFILQGKGGVGKSLISSLLLQYLSENKIGSKGFDTDPNNATLFNYKNLNVDKIEIAEGHAINKRKFDNLVELVVAKPAIYIVDNGANTFMPFFEYIEENDLFNFIKNEFNINVYVHTVITAGQAMTETLEGALKIITNKGILKKSVVVWVNEFWGKISSSVEINDYKVISSYPDIVIGGIRIPEMSSDTFGTDISMMLEDHLTFEEIKKSDDFSFMAKSRLARFHNDMFNRIEMLFKLMDN